MSKLHKITAMTVSMILLVSSLAMADPLAMFIEDQQIAWDESLQIWSAGGSRTELLGAIKQGIQAESGMMAYGVSFNDERLYSREAAKINPTEPEQFVYMLFLKRMSESGYSPMPAKTTFSGRNFAISRTAGSSSEKVNF